MEGPRKVSEQLGPVNLLYSDVETDLRDAVRRMLADRSPWPAVLERMETDKPYDDAVWRGLVELGATGLAVPEEFGGAGATFREVAVVMEELGRSVAPTPYLGSAVLATAAVLALPQSTGGVLEALAEGTVMALAVPLGVAPGADPPLTVSAERGSLTGTLRNVADAGSAQTLLVPVVEADGAALYRVDAAAGELTSAPTMDLTRRLATLSLDAAAGERLVGGDEAMAAVRGALTVGAAMLASEQLGLAERCLEMTVEHLKSRHQFGRPIGSFQALKHRVAQVWVSVAQARAVARNAADRLAALGPAADEAVIAAAVAQAHCSGVAVRAAEECVQLHGGIGFTWEHPAHLYLKRARSDALAFGTADRHRSLLAQLVDLPIG